MFSSARITSLGVDEVEIPIEPSVVTAKAALPLKPVTIDFAGEHGDGAIKLRLKLPWEILNRVAGYR